MVGAKTRQFGLSGESSESKEEEIGVEEGETGKYKEGHLKIKIWPQKHIKALANYFHYHIQVVIH